MFPSNFELKEIDKLLVFMPGSLNPTIFDHNPSNFEILHVCRCRFSQIIGRLSIKFGPDCHKYLAITQGDAPAI
jgi:hypothetical protein